MPNVDPTPAAMPSARPSSSRREAVRRAVAEACDAIAPAWPLDQLIAVNPLWPLTHQPLGDVAAVLGAPVVLCAGFWLGPQPIIILAFFTILDAIAYPLFTLFSLIAVLAQLRPWRFTWHPWAGLLLVVGGSFFIVDALLTGFAK
jgi:hypothetical protein